MNVSNDAPALLHKNPETDEDEIASKFMELYRLARKHLCNHILDCSFVDSVWDSAMRPGSSLDEYNPVDYKNRLGQMIEKAWREVKPPIQQADLFIDEDPSLLDVHSGLTHTFGPEMAEMMPERIVIYNLRMWVTQGLYHFWDHRLTGERMALFNVRESEVRLKGVLPRPVLDVHTSTSEKCPYQYNP